MTDEPMKPFHPLADIFPLMEGADFDALVASIKAQGLEEHITVLDDMILDGRNRARACEAAGVEPLYKPFLGDDPLAFVIAKNLTRRHLDESQRAMVAARIATLGHGQRQTGKLAGVPTQTEAAAMMNVSERSVRSAHKVIDSGTPELAKAVDAGGVKVSAAAEIVDLPPEEVSVVAAVLAEAAASTPGAKAKAAEAVKAAKEKVKARKPGKAPERKTARGWMDSRPTLADMWEAALPNVRKMFVAEIGLRNFYLAADDQARADLVREFVTEPRAVRKGASSEAVKAAADRAELRSGSASAPEPDKPKRTKKPKPH